MAHNATVQRFALAYNTAQEEQARLSKKGTGQQFQKWVYAAFFPRFFSFILSLKIFPKLIQILDIFSIGHCDSHISDLSQAISLFTFIDFKSQELSPRATL